MDCTSHTIYVIQDNNHHHNSYNVDDKMEKFKQTKKDFNNQGEKSVTDIQERETRGQTRHKEKESD